jgi:hypothetical protein
MKIHALSLASAFPLGLGLALMAQANSPIDDVEGFHGVMPQAGEFALRSLTPELLELIRINTQPQGGVPDAWHFVNGAGEFTAPATSTFEVAVNGDPVVATVHGFRRRPLYAPLKQRDLRVDNRLFLQLAEPLEDGDEIEVATNGWSTEPETFTATHDPMRRNSSIHVNQEGYATLSPKQAVVGYYLGNAGELILPTTIFEVIDESDGLPVLTGALTRKTDIGYIYQPTPYQKVWVADFSALEVPGRYRLSVPGMGVSLPFEIHDGMLMNFARTFALGMYQQRCGHAVELPYSRHCHGICHTAPAEVPNNQADFATTWSFVASGNANFANNPRHTAPRLASPADMLYPFVRTGAVDVTGGHHDAGDYSKYTINSAQLVHHLVFAADLDPAVASLDNLGIPESGDGKSDLLQIAKHEADFLARMQDDDGGFYFLVYPKNRRYEHDVLPDQGDSQVVWPKNTSATAAAVAALAEIGSSPRFQLDHPQAAAEYLRRALDGWAFLLDAIDTHGKDGSYQKLTHYGDIFMHDDELAWAAAAMFAATGDATAHQKLVQWFDPSAHASRRWGWWRLFEGYGCAARTYAFAARSGRRTAAELNSIDLAKCEAEILAAGNDVLKRSQRNAYGTSFDLESKRHMTAGWYFSSDWAFDMSVAHALVPDPAIEVAVMANLNYEFGCNPHNISFVSGAGQRHQRETVHQFAQNDDRVLPPTGIAQGNIQQGFPWLSPYTNSLGALVFPSDGGPNPHPFYDRWGDTYNTMTEFVISQQARMLANAAIWAAKTPASQQAWTVPAATLEGPQGYLPAGEPVTFTLEAAGLDLSQARVIWESTDLDPWTGGTERTFIGLSVGAQWVEAEAVLPDGRRVSAMTEFATHDAAGGTEHALDAHTVALYHFSGGYEDSGPNGFHLQPNGNVQRVTGNAGWMSVPSGEVARFSNVGDTLSISIPDAHIAPGSSASPFTFEAWIFPRAYRAWGVDNKPILSLHQHWDSALEVYQNKWGSPAAPMVHNGTLTMLTPADWNAAVSLNSWQHFKITRNAQSEFKIWIDGVCIHTSTSFPNYGRGNAWTLTIGNFDGDVDEVRLSNIVR